MCSNCGGHGAIVFKDGSKSETITSIEGGKELLKELLSSGKLSFDESDRIEDHLVCSEMVQTEEEALVLAILSLACFTLKEVVDADRIHLN
ncbi:MAG: hypothetical protein WDZ88_01140 [Candidatus Paceibacterota bacterium]